MWLYVLYALHGFEETYEINCLCKYMFTLFIKLSYMFIYAAVPVQINLSRHVMYWFLTRGTSGSMQRCLKVYDIIVNDGFTSQKAWMLVNSQICCFSDRLPFLKRTIVIHQVFIADQIHDHQPCSWRSFCFWRSDGQTGTITVKANVFREVDLQEQGLMTTALDCPVTHFFKPKIQRFYIR